MRSLSDEPIPSGLTRNTAASLLPPKNGPWPACSSRRPSSPSVTGSSVAGEVEIVPRARGGRLASQLALPTLTQQRINNPRLC